MNPIDAQILGFGQQQKYKREIREASLHLQEPKYQPIMNKEKIYILLKDLPDGSKAGDEYKLRHRTGDQYVNQRLNDDKSPVIEYASWYKCQVENNPEWWKLKEEEKPTVYYYGSTGNYIDFINEKDCSTYKITKERLAEILIAERDNNILIGKRLSGIYPERFIGTDMIYTERDLLEAKEKWYNIGKGVAYQNPPSFSDYMNSLNDK